MLPAPHGQNSNVRSEGLRRVGHDAALYPVRQITPAISDRARRDANTLRSAATVPPVLQRTYGITQNGCRFALVYERVRVMGVVAHFFASVSDGANCETEYDRRSNPEKEQ